jgi:hypothetical protein
MRYFATRLFEHCDVNTAAYYLLIPRDHVPVFIPRTDRAVMLDCLDMIPVFSENLDCYFSGQIEKLNRPLICESMFNQ